MVKIQNKYKAKVRKFLLVLLVILLLLLSIQIVFAGTWYKGTLHQHTGFSANNGYDNINDGSSDECEPLLEGDPRDPPVNGRNVTTIVDKAKTFGHSFIGITDHSYCLDPDEFDTIKQDCEDNTDSSFICLPGEEVSTIYSENYEGGNGI